MLLVTGGAGFIGSTLIAHLNKKTSDPIIVVDALGTDNKWQNLKKHLISDIICPEKIDDFLKAFSSKIKCIFHLGAISTTTEQNADLIVRNNLRLSLDLLEFCTTAQIPFIYASSAATYGDGKHGFEDANSSPALAKLLPLNAYAWSKHLFDRIMIHRAEHHHPLPPQWVGLKFFNVYGPNEYHKGSQRSVVHQLFQVINEGKPAQLFKSYHPDFNDGEQKRDFIWVGDCTKIMLWFYENKSKSGIFNVGTGTARTFLDLTLSVYECLQRKPNIQFIDMPDGLAEKYQYFTEASLNTLRYAGYNAPFTSLEEGIKTYIHDYLTTTDPYC